jgi:biopolymer transport protein ExbD/biopolymer transport protein TolR
MLVLLVIFMVTAPLLQRGLNVNLPEARRSNPLSEERIFVTVPLSFRTDGQIMVDEDFVSLEALNERLSRDMEGQTDRSVFLRGDGEITYQELMDVIDRLKESGVEEVGLLSREPSN